MAKVKRKYPTAFKINGQLIRLADGESKQEILDWLDQLERVLENPKYANCPITRAGLIDSFSELAKGQTLHAAMTAKGFI
jgi:hypothetical protein